MDLEPAEMLNVLRSSLMIARIRQRERWQRKVCIILYREESLLAGLAWYVGELERQMRGEAAGN